MMGLADKFLPTDLPGQVKLMLGLLARIEQAILDLRASLAPAPTPPQAETVWRNLPISNLGQGASLVTLIVGGDTAGLYSFQIGSAVIFSFYLAANTTQVFNLPLGRHLGLTAGQQVIVNVPTNANSTATIAYLPREGAR